MYIFPQRNIQLNDFEFEDLVRINEWCAKGKKRGGGFNYKIEKKYWNSGT